MPGTYVMFVGPDVSLGIERHSVRDLVFESSWADFLIKERPHVVGRHFTCVETNDFQVALVYVGGELVKVLPPAKRVLFWRGSAHVTAELVDVIGDVPIPEPESRSTPALAAEKTSWLSSRLRILLRMIRHLAGSGAEPPTV